MLATNSAKVRELIFDMRARAAQEIMDIVQTHLTETSTTLKEESVKEMQDLEAVFNKDQKISSCKSVEDHTDKHLKALTETLSRRRELLILNQPTLNEAITMKSKRRAYPARKDRGGPLTGTYEDLTDLSDEDENERFEKKAEACKKTNTPEPKQGNNSNQGANPRAPRRGQLPARSQNHPTYEQPQQGPSKRPCQTYEQAPSTSRYTKHSYGNKTWNTNQQTNRWQLLGNPVMTGTLTLPPLLTLHAQHRRPTKRTQQGRVMWTSIT